MNDLDWLDLNCDNNGEKCHMCKRKESCVYNYENKLKNGADK